MLMNEYHIGFIVLCMVLLWSALRGLLFRRHLFRLPTIAAMLGLAWIVPQGLVLEALQMNAYASEAFWLYVTACFLFLNWGFGHALRQVRKRVHLGEGRAWTVYSSRRLMLSTAALIAVGLASFGMMSRMDVSAMGGQWTGIATLYALFAKSAGLGLCLAVLIYAQTKSTLAVSLAILASLPLIGMILGGVRREVIFDLVLLTAGSWFLAKHRYPSRTAVILALVVGIAILNNAGTLRGHIAEGRGSLFTAFFSKDLLAELSYVDNDRGQYSEMGQAQYDFWYMNQSWNWEYGAGYWNALVSQYVPAFIVGRAAKESIMVDSLSRRMSSGSIDGVFLLGATRTGFSDTYANFGFFGVAVFWLIGYGFGRLYALSASGEMAGIFLYLALLAEGLKSITHSTSELLSALPFLVGISIAALRISRLSSGDPRPRRVHASDLQGERSAATVRQWEDRRGPR